uniref:C3H1-type domain-containing protein n=1 Tax=Riptortus pedestris TaxID=329032 RepID=R4WSZ5_RIPPE|nr:hypothetical protein [Riptortus pedestris]
MSKTSKRKSGGESSKNSKSLSVKDSHKRPSVFERLGTKASSIPVASLTVNISNQSDFCRNWIQNGTCPYGKSCKLSYSHTLISPSKRNIKKEDLDKRVSTALVRRGSPPEVGEDWETWDQSDLEYEDENVLERRRQHLQRELELQMKKETSKQETSKHRSSSTSSYSSSTSSSGSSSGSSSDSSVSTQKKVEPKVSVSPTILERNIIIKKNMGKGIHKESPPRKSSTSKKVSPSRKSSRRKSLTPTRKPPLSPPPKSKPVPMSRSSDRGSRRNDSPVGSRGRSPDRKQSSRASGSSRRSPRSSAPRRGRSPRPRPPSRNRTPDRRKEDDRRKDDSRRSDRKSDFRDKREAAREKERVEALERCRERQREREALAKERERERKEREKRRRGYSSSTSRRTPPRDEKRHDRKTDRDRSYSRERARDRALERVMERRGSSRERSYERPYSQNSPSYRGTGSDRNRYANERVSSERNSAREERRGRRWVESREKQSGSREWSEHPDWENRSRRNHHADKDKEHPSSELPKEKDTKDLIPPHSKRGVDDMELGVGKRPRLDEVSLQEELSDISDDPDDILNREDVEFMDRDVAEEAGDGSANDSTLQVHTQDENSQPPHTPCGDRNNDPRMVEDDAIVSLDFEEISDEELEEESKSNKGVSVVDALGVDWASLVAEWRPPREIPKEGSARSNWGSEAIFRRIGVSPDLAGDHLLGRITKTYLTGNQNDSETKKPVLPSSLLENKQALSARTDIIIRRQLCGLPVISSETHPTTGLCQWAV